MKHRSPAAAMLSVAILTLASACGGNIDVKQAVQIADVTGGYYDAGIKDGKNKLVPSVTFQVRKSVEDSIRPLALNVVFKTITPTGDEDFEDVFVQNVSFNNGNQSTPLTLRPNAGYTGDPPQSRAEMLQNKHFQDMRVVVFAKHSSSNWVELTRFDLPRTLITH